MGYTLDDFYDDVVKDAQDVEELVSRIADSGSPRRFDFIRKIVEAAGGGCAYTGLRDFAYSPYGMEAKHFFILVDSGGETYKMIGHVPPGFTIVLNPTDETSEDDSGTPISGSGRGDKLTH